MKQFILLLAGVLAFSAQASVEAEIKKTLDENLKYTLAEDMDGMMSTLHTASPSYASTKQAMSQLFPVYDLKYKILSFNYVGEEGGYAYARILQRTEKVSGPNFNNNELEALQIYRKENGKWKLWSQANLNIKFL